MQLQSLEDHCAAIAKAIDNADLCRIDDRWTVLLADWLSIAAGIVSLEYDHFRVDRLAGYCESADAWEGVREKILTGFVTSLVKFSLVWGALEAAITIIEPPSSGLTRGKINAACFYLLKHFGVGASISGYRPALAAFLETARERYGADVLKKEVRLRDDLGISGIDAFAPSIFFGTNLRTVGLSSPSQPAPRWRRRELHRQLSISPRD